MFTNLKIETFWAPQRLEGVSEVRDLSVGPNFACAVLADRRVGCWGAGGNGLLGGLRALFEPTPVPVEGIREASKVVSGRWHSCALFSGGHVACWGVRWEPPSMDRPTPSVELEDPVDITPAPPGSVVPRAEFSDRDVRNLLTAAAPMGPGLIEGLGPVRDLEAGGTQTCALLEAGGVSCWSGPSSLMSLENDGQPPTVVPGLDDVESIAVGHRFACALSAGAVSCWGTLSGVMDDALTPVVVPELAGARSIHADEDTLCAIGDKGHLRCVGSIRWGDR